MARVGRRGGLVYILIKICHLDWKIDTKSLFSYFSRMNWIHKFQMRVFEGGQCWHECQGDWRINIVNLKEIQPPCPAQCLPSNSCSILFCLFNWAVVVQKRHKMMINLLSGEFKAQRVISWFPPSNSLFRLCLEVSHEDRSEWDLRANIVWSPLDHRLTIAWPSCVVKPIKPGLLPEICHAWSSLDHHVCFGTNFALLLSDLCHVATTDLRLNFVISIVRDPNSSTVIFLWSIDPLSGSIKQNLHDPPSQNLSPLRRYQPEIPFLSGSVSRP